MKSIKEKLALKRANKKLIRAKGEPGRPKGSTVSLLKRDIRFEVAIFLSLRVFGLNKYAAARAAIMITSSQPISLSHVDEIILKISTGYRSAVLKRSRYIIETAEAWEKTDDIHEYDWMINSLSMIGTFLLFIAVEDTAGQLFLMDLLCKSDAGWHKVIASIAQRLSCALQSNIGPDEDKPSRFVRALGKRLREKHLKNQ